jgi:peptidoglycan/xylan/chitin deacetylase (PgdA/CDA1 family)/folate-dependent phosphoribosylglycinamide formyltransferase PurN
MPRIAIFSADVSFAVRKGIIELNHRIPGVEWLVVRQVPPRNLSKLARNQWRNLRRNGWRWPFHQAADICRGLFQSVMERNAKPLAGPGSEYGMDRILARPNVHYFETSELHGQDALERIRDFAPDLGISLAAPVLKETLFAIPRLGTINLHKGKLPAHRGMPPAFWELWNDEITVGCTVHRVNAGLDQGEIIAETEVPRHRYSTVKGLQLTLDEIGIRLTCDAVEAMLASTAEFRAQPAGGQTYRKPTLKQVSQLRRRLAHRLPARDAVLRRVAKFIYLVGCLYLGRAWLWLFSKKPTVAVVLYHRVSDEWRDSLTTGIEQFERQMALIRKYCYPVSIEEVISGRVPPNSSKPLVCVTFDDGYKDNYTTAVPLLLRHQIPAAFFVSTGFVGAVRHFPHDEGKLPARFDNMTWDDLRQMKKNGFVIGSHTVNHINCAKEPIDTVQRELRESLDKVRHELTTHDVILAYPFGGREHMTPERLELVKQAGYTACLSAYGGFNRGTINQYNILRCGINWGFSDLAFRCRIGGLI